MPAVIEVQHPGLVTSIYQKRSPEYNLERWLIEALELTYVIRRVERHDRSPENPWSVRQTGVYHKLTYEQRSQPKSTFILLAPSSTAEKGLLDQLNCEITEDDITTSAFSVHQRLLADSLEGWMEYMEWLEKVTKRLVGAIHPFYSCDRRQVEGRLTTESLYSETEWSCPTCASTTSTLTQITGQN